MKDFLKTLFVAALIGALMYGLTFMHRFAFRPGSEAQKGFDAAIGIGSCTRESR